MEKITASIITIGDELLIGQVVDTNSAWMARELNKAGIMVHQRVAVGDVWDDIWQALNAAAEKSPIILVTGGLGPTADDITKPLLCAYFGGRMVMHEPTLAHVTYLFEQVFRRPGPLLERNRRQAEVPDVCTVLKNERGTAPGMLFEKNGRVFISMPGVPHEMQGLMLDHVLPFLQQRFALQHVGHRTLLTAGVGESVVAEMLKEYEPGLPGFMKLAYLPSYGMVRLRLTATGERDIVESALDKQFAALQQIVREYLVTNEDIPMQEVVGRLLKSMGATMATAESCTGGNIAHLVTTIPGSSAWFMGSVVSYDNSIKTQVLGVPEQTLAEAGAVSEATVIAMAKGAVQLLHTDFAIAVSGIMGPDGGTPDKPVGTVWMAAANATTVQARQIHLRFDRQRNIDITSLQALNFLRQFILQHGKG